LVIALVVFLVLPLRKVLFVLLAVVAQVVAVGVFIVQTLVQKRFPIRLTVLLDAHVECGFPYKLGVCDVKVLDSLERLWRAYVEVTQFFAIRFRLFLFRLRVNVLPRVESVLDPFQRRIVQTCVQRRKPQLRLNVETDRFRPHAHRPKFADFVSQIHRIVLLNRIHDDVFLSSDALNQSDGIPKQKLQFIFLVFNLFGRQMCIFCERLHGFFDSVQRILESGGGEFGAGAPQVVVGDDGV